MAWWHHEGKHLHRILNEKERKELERFTGGMPILLRIFGPLASLGADYQSKKSIEASAEFSDDSEGTRTLDVLYEHFWKNPEALKLAEMITEFIDREQERLSSSKMLHELREAIEGCLMERPIESRQRRLLDGRSFYVGLDGRGRVTSEFVRQIVHPYVRNLQGTGTLFSPNFATNSHLSSNPSVLGYQIEAMMLSCIAQHGFVMAGREFGKVEKIIFFNMKHTRILFSL